MDATTITCPTARCGWCQAPVQPTWGQKSALTKGRQVYCAGTDCARRAQAAQTADWQAQHADDGYDPRHYIGHCNQWHVLDALPWTCPTCGQRVGQQREENTR